jgi:flagellar biosynthetic protein FliR
MIWRRHASVAAGRGEGHAAARTPMTVSFLPELSALFMLVFARVGTMVMLMPGIGERFVLSRARLVLAFFMALILMPLLRPQLPVPQTGQALLLLLFGEILTGLVLAGAVRLVLACLQTAGVIVANMLGLSFATTVDPGAGAQNPTIGNFLVLLGTTLIMVTDLHHMALAAIHESYRVLPPFGGLPPGDVLMLALKAMAKGFALAVQISAPFIVFGLVFNLGLGVLSRLMPAMQVYFVAMPASILIGMVILLAVVSVMMGAFLEHLSDFLKQIAGL